MDPRFVFDATTIYWVKAPGPAHVQQIAIDWRITVMNILRTRHLAWVLSVCTATVACLTDTDGGTGANTGIDGGTGANTGIDGGAGADTGIDGGAGADTGIDASTVPDPRAKPCLVSDNIFVIAGDGYVHRGSPLVIRGGAGWVISVSNAIDNIPSYLWIRPGANWSAEFSTRSLGRPLLPGTYTDAQRAAFTDPNHPGLDISGDGRGCNTITGQFQVIEMRSSLSDAGAPVVESFTAVFEQHCEGAAEANTGCVHVSQAPHRSARSD
ncbi:hypothetical protein [Pendulispora albinea]|uniref:Uncharacterized protein n=1 Tax=Pendulispora albinea TaxID=2741071 RepID=A0ABZ2M3X5_9BACT